MSKASLVTLMEMGWDLRERVCVMRGEERNGVLGLRVKIKINK